MNKGILVTGLIITLLSCKKDDGPDPVEIPPRALSEVAAEDAAEIKAYLETHFYNYEEFANPPADFDYKIKIDTLAGENAGKTPLSEQVATQSITIESSSFGRTDGEEVPHTLYHLTAREGVGGSPTIGDYTVLQYEGSLLDGSLFDAANTPVNQYLSNTVRGYGNGIINYKTGEGPFENGDGTVRFENYGIGMIFIPSGLAYFDRPPSGIPAYSPIVFKIDVLSYRENTDYDQDGIPSILEDLDGDGNLNNDNTDGDFSQLGPLYNHLDPDDDNDGIPTREEITIDAEGNISFPDSDNDGTPDYLDNDNL